MFQTSAISPHSLLLMLPVVEAEKGGGPVALVRRFSPLQAFVLAYRYGICTREKWTAMTLNGLLRLNLSFGHRTSPGNSKWVVRDS